MAFMPDASTQGPKHVKSCEKENRPMCLSETHSSSLSPSWAHTLAVCAAPTPLEISWCASQGGRGLTVLNIEFRGREWRTIMSSRELWSLERSKMAEEGGPRRRPLKLFPRQFPGRLPHLIKGW